MCVHLPILTCVLGILMGRHIGSFDPPPESRETTTLPANIIATPINNANPSHPSTQSCGRPRPNFGAGDARGTLRGHVDKGPLKIIEMVHISYVHRTLRMTTNCRDAPAMCVVMRFSCVSLLLLRRMLGCAAANLRAPTSLSLVDHQKLPEMNAVTLLRN
jgi:hypothetical protein